MGLQVAVLEWIEPVFPGGHWTPEIVKIAGAEHPLNPARQEVHTLRSVSDTISLKPLARGCE